MHSHFCIVFGIPNENFYFIECQKLLSQIIGTIDIFFNIIYSYYYQFFPKITIMYDMNNMDACLRGNDTWLKSTAWHVSIFWQPTWTNALARNDELYRANHTFPQRVIVYWALRTNTCETAQVAMGIRINKLFYLKFNFEQKYKTHSEKKKPYCKCDKNITGKLTSFVDNLIHR